MRLIGDLLGEVLANTAKLVAERKALICEGGGVHWNARDPEEERATKSCTRLKRVAGGKGGPGFKSTASAFITDHTAPAGHGTSPKTSAGNNGSEVNALELSGDIHDARTAAIQTTTGVAITAYEIQK